LLVQLIARILTDALVALGNQLPSAADHEAFLRTLLDAPISQWCGSDIETVSEPISSKIPNMLNMDFIFHFACLLSALITPTNSRDI
jgi:hypothetical protein